MTTLKKNFTIEAFGIRYPLTRQSIKLSPVLSKKFTTTNEIKLAMSDNMMEAFHLVYSFLLADSQIIHELDKETFLNFIALVHAFDIEILKYRIKDFIYPLMGPSTKVLVDRTKPPKENEVYDDYLLLFKTYPWLQRDIFYRAYYFKDFPREKSQNLLDYVGMNRKVEYVYTKLMPVSKRPLAVGELMNPKGSFNPPTSPILSVEKSLIEITGTKGYKYYAYRTQDNRIYFYYDGFIIDLRTRSVHNPTIYSASNGDLIIQKKIPETPGDTCLNKFFIEDKTTGRRIYFNYGKDSDYISKTLFFYFAGQVSRYGIAMLAPEEILIKLF